MQLCCCCCCCPVSLFVSASVNQLTTLRIRRIGLLHKCTNTRLQLTNLVCVCAAVCVCVFVCPVINMQMLIIIACHKSKRIELCARLGVCSTYFRTPLIALLAMEIEAESGMPSTAPAAGAGSGCGFCGLRVRVCVCVYVCCLWRSCY